MPGKYYIYIPFNQSSVDELLGLAQGWGENRSIYTNDSTTDRKKPTIIQHAKHQISEKIVEPPDQYTLYILAHCNKTSVTNTNNVFLRGRETLTPTGLANRMISDGLPRNIRNLKLFACNSGVAADGARHSFGKLLFHALITRGFDNIRLSAYTTPLKGKTVDSTTGHKRTEDNSRPSTRRIQWP